MQKGEMDVDAIKLINQEDDLSVVGSAVLLEETSCNYNYTGVTCV